MDQINGDSNLVIVKQLLSTYYFVEINRIPVTKLWKLIFIKMAKQTQLIELKEAKLGYIMYIE